ASCRSTRVAPSARGRRRRAPRLDEDRDRRRDASRDHQEGSGRARGSAPRTDISKTAPVVRACQRRNVPFLLLHTGQHYSFEMDGVFFRELDLPAPHANLEVGSGAQAYQIASIISGTEPILMSERPDVLLVEGDTNSVLATALAANKLGIQVG